MSALSADPNELPVSHDAESTYPIHAPRQMKVICIGAGASGLLLAYKLQRSFEKFDLTIYEKNVQIGGTWFENTYPGCSCDVPAHIYTYSFEPNPSWSSMYCGSDEILNYFTSFARKYDLHKYVKLEHKVSAATWNDDTGKWDLQIELESTGECIRDTCDILIGATGLLNAKKWPNIRSLQDYKGTLLHTANWDSSVKLSGKRVGLIGNGSSGIQVLPPVSGMASKVTTFIRSPTWVHPNLAGFSTQMKHSYSEDERSEFLTDPQSLLLHRKALETSMHEIFPMMLANSTEQRMIREALKQAMHDKLQDARLADLIIPSFPVGCRRYTPGMNYLETLNSDNVEVVYGEIEYITETGCRAANGSEFTFDVLICATGFDVSYRPRFPLIGLQGKNLADVWASEPKSYFGLAANDYPNYFMIMGPNSPISNGPVLFAIEAQVDYILKFMNRWQTEHVHRFFPKMEAIQDFIQFKDVFMEKTVWNECHSWYKSTTSGKLTGPWPGSTLHYIEAIKDPRYEDWDFKYIGNRFSFFGDGRSQVEMDKTADWAYYIRNKDDSPLLSRIKNMKSISKGGRDC